LQGASLVHRRVEIHTNDRSASIEVDAEPETIFGLLTALARLGEST